MDTLTPGNSKWQRNARRKDINFVTLSISFFYFIVFFFMIQIYPIFFAIKKYDENKYESLLKITKQISVFFRFFVCLLLLFWFCTFIAFTNFRCEGVFFCFKLASWFQSEMATVVYHELTLARISNFELSLAVKDSV